MTRYTVLWNSDVESQFIDAWLAGDRPCRAASFMNVRGEEGVVSSQSGWGTGRDARNLRWLVSQLQHGRAR